MIQDERHAIAGGVTGEPLKDQRADKELSRLSTLDWDYLAAGVHGL
jgi:hypothetical protein